MSLELYMYLLLVSLSLLRDKECRFYDSKMRPLLMVYGNPDPSVTPQDVRVIFKNGDGNDNNSLECILQL